MGLETVTVKAPSKYGFQAVDGTYYNISKKAQEKGLKPEAFSAGQEYVLDIWVSSSGKKYVNAAPKPTNNAAVEKNMAKATKLMEDALNSVALPKTKAEKPKVYGREASDYELEKDRRISIQGIAQSIIGSPMFTMVPDIANVEVFETALETFSRAALKVSKKLLDESK